MTTPTKPPPKLRTYWVTWTYVANFSGPTPVQAVSREDAARQVFWYAGNESFQKQVTVHVSGVRPKLFTKDAKGVITTSKGGT